MRGGGRPKDTLSSDGVLGHEVLPGVSPACCPSYHARSPGALLVTGDPRPGGALVTCQAVLLHRRFQWPYFSRGVRPPELSSVGCASCEAQAWGWVALGDGWRPPGQEAMM